MLAIRICVAVGVVVVCAVTIIPAAILAALLTMVYVFACGLDYIGFPSAARFIARFDAAMEQLSR